MVTPTDPNATTTVTATATTTTTFTTTETPDEQVTGNFEFNFDSAQADNAIASPDFKAGVEAGIANITGCPDEWVTASLSKKVTRRLTIRELRRLSTVSIVVDYTINIPVNKPSGFTAITGNTVSDAISTASTAAITTSVQDAVAAAVTSGPIANALATLAVTVVALPAVVTFTITTSTVTATTTTVTVTTTDAPPPASSWARMQMAFSGAHVAAVLLGVVFMQ